jgi:hypothetical protein
MPGLIAPAVFAEHACQKSIVDLSSQASADCARATATTSVRQFMADSRSCSARICDLIRSSSDKLNSHPAICCTRNGFIDREQRLLELPGLAQAFRQRADEAGVWIFYC